MKRDTMFKGIREFEDRDINNVLEIFNHYVINSFSAYPENPIPTQMFVLFKEMTRGYPFLVALDEKDEVIGFGFLHAHNRMPSFSGSAEISYFIHPDQRRSGIGSILFRELASRGKQQGIHSILASISSLNDKSINFHRKMGFEEAGRFKGVIKKKGTVMDEVWMQIEI